MKQILRAVVLAVGLFTPSASSLLGLGMLGLHIKRAASRV
jgi:hypothetical protein